MTVDQISRLPAESNPLWKWERSWIYTRAFAVIVPAVFLLALWSGCSPFGLTSPQAAPHGATCVNCACGDFARRIVGVPIGTAVSLLMGAVLGGILDCFPNHPRR